MASKQSPFIWYDLMTPDMRASEKFYANVVGWTIKDSGMPGPSYSMLQAGNDIAVGGIMGLPPGYAENGGVPMWTGYIYVDDVDAKSQDAVKRGGSICKPPADIPGVGRFATVADPHGAMFNIFKPNSTAQPAPVPEGTPGQSAGVNCMPETARQIGISMPPCLAGPRERQWIWAPMEFTRSSRSTGPTRVL